MEQHTLLVLCDSPEDVLFYETHFEQFQASIRLVCVHDIHIAQDASTQHHYTGIICDVSLTDAATIEFLKSSMSPSIVLLLRSGEEEILLNDSTLIRLFWIHKDSNHDYLNLIPAILKSKPPVKRDLNAKTATKIIERLALFVDACPSEVLLFNSKGIVEYQNRRSLLSTTPAHSGTPQGKYVGKHINDYLIKEFQFDQIQGVWEALHTQKSWSGEAYKTPSFSLPKWFSLEIVPCSNQWESFFYLIQDDISVSRLTEESLRLSKANLLYQNNVLEQDMRIAHSIQDAFLPKVIPDSFYLHIDYHYTPLEKMGGDYFSFTALKEGGLGIFIGDVSGHGISAALFLSLVKATTDRVCRKYGTKPKDYITNLNHEMKNNMPSSHLTALFGLFTYQPESNTVQFTFSKGGHPFPIQYEKSSRASLFIESRGTLIGLFDQIFNDERTIILKPGDRLYLYTDGIFEARNKNGILLDAHSFLSVVTQSSQLPLSESIKDIFEKIQTYREHAPLDDDMLLIGCEVPDVIQATSD